jgi:hypothetical protein
MNLGTSATKSRLRHGNPSVVRTRIRFKIHVSIESVRDTSNDTNIFFRRPAVDGIMTALVVVGPALKVQTHGSFSLLRQI